ncbi:MAG TPA: DoxX-like family protein [Planctomycetota bacterium]|jgi:hypothetical protein|nr:DoxX-like family protein [Planctomycetota bacterium]
MIASLVVPPVVIRGAVAAVWLYEGLWCKLLGRERRQLEIVAAAPRIGPLAPSTLLRALGLVEVALAAWAASGSAPIACAAAQTVLLVTLNSCGICFARRLIHDPAGMVVKNLAFLVLAWVAASLPR